LRIADVYDLRILGPKMRLFRRRGTSRDEKRDETPEERVIRLVAEYEAAHPGMVIHEGDPLGSEGDALITMLAEELAAKIAMGTMGDIHPSKDEIDRMAYWLAATVIWNYIIRRRDRGEMPVGKPTPD
jgi:hypothetical protein